MGACHSNIGENEMKMLFLNNEKSLIYLFIIIIIIIIIIIKWTYFEPKSHSDKTSRQYHTNTSIMSPFTRSTVPSL